jgi:hypothetical protein
MRTNEDNPASARPWTRDGGQPPFQVARKDAYHHHPHTTIPGGGVYLSYRLTFYLSKVSSVQSGPGTLPRPILGGQPLIGPLSMPVPLAASAVPGWWFPAASRIDGPIRSRAPENRSFGHGTGILRRHAHRRTVSGSKVQHPSKHASRTRQAGSYRTLAGAENCPPHYRRTSGDVAARQQGYRTRYPVTTFSDYRTCTEPVIGGGGGRPKTRQIIG